MGKFTGHLLVSDLDGTLIDNANGISRENLAAIHAFVAAGGRFAVATGRTELNVLPYAQELPRHSPWILYNGAGIYDWEQDAFLYKATLDRELATAFVRRIIARLPHVNVQIYAGGPFCDINPQAQPDRVAVEEKQAFIHKPLEAIDDGWLKIIFCSNLPDELAQIETLLAGDELARLVHKTRSSPRYFELTAAGVNKGEALRRLKRLLQPAPERVIAIGDYLNDVEMLHEADISAAPQSALAEVREQARIITVSHQLAAVADLVRRLEAMFS